MTRAKSGRAGVRLGAVLVGAAMAPRTVSAAIDYTTAGNIYTQNFDSFAGAAGPVSFTDNVTIPGFYAHMSGDSGETVSGPPDVIDRNSGASTVQAGATTTAFPTAGAYYPFYFYRTGAAATNVGFGFYNSDTNSVGVGTGYIAAGFALLNDTGAPLTSFTLNYTVSALANTTTAPDPVSVSYAINATGVGSADGTYVTAPGLGYSVASGGVVTGPTASTVTGIDVEPGSTLFVRFLDTNISGTDSYSIIDNIALSAVPEPASLSVLGFGGLLLVRSRRQR